MRTLADAVWVDYDFFVAIRGRDRKPGDARHAYAQIEAARTLDPSLMVVGLAWNVKVLNLNGLDMEE
jgi:hypothetical protein